MNKKDVKTIEIAKELLRAHGYFVDNLWHVDDIHFICEQKGIAVLSNSEAMEVFIIANEQFEGETGLGWPQLENALNCYVRRKSLLQNNKVNEENISL